MAERLLPRPVPLGLSREEAARVTVVYLVTAPSGKQYVGITNQKPQRRWVQHASKAMAGHGPRHPFYCAIRKYGRKAFTCSVLEVCPSDEAAQDAEKRWICELRTVAPHGYNLSLGGEENNGVARAASREARRLVDPEFDRHIRDSKKKSAITRDARRAADPEFDREFLASVRSAAPKGSAAVSRKRAEDPEYDARFREKKRRSLAAARAKQAEASRAAVVALSADPDWSARRSAQLVAAWRAIREDPERRAQRSLNQRKSWTPERRAAQRERALLLNARRWHSDG
jgi:hypothetical protein